MKRYDKTGYTLGELSNMTDEEIIAAVEAKASEAETERFEKLSTIYENYQKLLEWGVFDGDFVHHYCVEYQGDTYNNYLHYDFSSQKESVVKAVNEWNALVADAESLKASFTPSVKFTAETDDTSNYIVQESIFYNTTQPYIGAEDHFDKDMFLELGFEFDENNKISWANENDDTPPLLDYHPDRISRDYFREDKNRYSVDDSTHTCHAYFMDDSYLTEFDRSPSISQIGGDYTVIGTSGPYTIYDSSYKGFRSDYDVLLKRVTDKVVNYTFDSPSAEGITIDG